MKKQRCWRLSQAAATGVSALTDICIETLGIKERPRKIALYAAHPKLEIVSVGPTAAVVSGG